METNNEAMKQSKRYEKAAGLPDLALSGGKDPQVKTATAAAIQARELMEAVIYNEQRHIAREKLLASIDDWPITRLRKLARLAKNGRLIQWVNSVGKE